MAPDLFDFAARQEAEPPCQRHSDTSRAAAEAIKPKAGTLRARVLANVVAKGGHGVTDEEGQAALGMNPNTYRPRRRELEQAGKVVDSGLRRPTHAGRKAVVWMATSSAFQDQGGE